MVSPIRTYEVIDFDEVLSGITELQRTATEIQEGRLTTGSTPGDLAVSYCVENNVYHKLGAVKSFWDEVDDKLRQSAGEMMVFTTYRPRDSVVAGSLATENTGLGMRSGRVHLPLTNVMVGDFVGNWDRVTSYSNLGNGYTKVNTSNEDGYNYSHPSALHGDMFVGHTHVGSCALGIGNDAARNFLHDEYKSGRISNGQKPARIAKVTDKTLDGIYFKIDSDEVYAMLEKQLR